MLLVYLPSILITLYFGYSAAGPMFTATSNFVPFADLTSILNMPEFQLCRLQRATPTDYTTRAQGRSFSDGVILAVWLPAPCYCE